MSKYIRFTKSVGGKALFVYSPGAVLCDIVAQETVSALTTSPKIDYEKINKNKSRYKYKLLSEYKINVGMYPEVDVKSDGVKLKKDGELIIYRGYMWDGPSGPTIDTSNFMRGALVHDALYQLMRDGLIDNKTYRKYADTLLKDICRQDGMTGFRANYVYRAVRMFGGRAARPKE